MRSGRSEGRQSLEESQQLSEKDEVRRAVENLLFWGVDSPTADEIFEQRIKIRRANSQDWRDPRMIRFGASRG